VLKTADFGYDGKGQVKLTSVDQLEAAWTGLRGAEGIYEAWVSFAQEISVVGARTLWGEFAAFPVFANTHVDHILDVTFAPAALDPRLSQEAVELARASSRNLTWSGCSPWKCSRRPTAGCWSMNWGRARIIPGT